MYQYLTLANIILITFYAYYQLFKADHPRDQHGVVEILVAPHFM